MHTTNTNKSETTPTEGQPRRYRTILADPPWMAGQQGKLGAQAHYNLMSLEEIKRLPVADLAEADAHVYVWCTPATRYVAEDVMRAWGFTYKDEFIWGKDQMGLGQYFRHAHETLLLGVKGKLPVQFKGQRSFAMLPRQDHSHKPEEIVSAMIPRLSPGPYLELFARRPTHGWDVWGNEVDSDIVIPGYPVPSDDRQHTEASPTEETADV